jgi:hypothetical protein
MNKQQINRWLFRFTVATFVVNIVNAFAQFLPRWLEVSNGLLFTAGFFYLYIIPAQTHLVQADRKPPVCPHCGKSLDGLVELSKSSLS